MEDYLEMLYRLCKGRGYVRQVDMAEALDVQPSSVTRMIQKLDEAGLISYEKYRNIALTDRGQVIGKFLVWRDQTLKRFLGLLGSGPGIDEQVEGIEHYITPNTMRLIRTLVTFFESNPLYLEEFRCLEAGHTYPDGEPLEELRAWLFRHSSED